MMIIVEVNHFFLSIDLGMYSMRLFSQESSMDRISSLVRPPTAPRDCSISLMCSSMSSLMRYGRSPKEDPGCTLAAFWVITISASSFLSFKSQSEAVRRTSSFSLQPSAVLSLSCFSRIALCFSMATSWSLIVLLWERLSLSWSRLVILMFALSEMIWRSLSVFWVRRRSVFSEFIWLSLAIRAYCDSSFSSTALMIYTAPEYFFIRSLDRSCDLLGSTFLGNMMDSPRTQYEAVLPGCYSFQMSSAERSSGEPMEERRAMMKETSSLCLSTSFSSLSNLMFLLSSPAFNCWICFSSKVTVPLFSFSCLYSLSLRMTSQSSSAILIQQQYQELSRRAYELQRIQSKRQQVVL